MNTKKKRNRIILCRCSILVLFASIFAVIPFNKDTKVDILMKMNQSLILKFFSLLFFLLN